MKQTRAAAEWLKTARRYTTVKAYCAIVNRAQEIAEERGAPLLGKIHCEIALKQLDEREIDTL